MLFCRSTDRKSRPQLNDSDTKSSQFMHLILTQEKNSAGMPPHLPPRNSQTKTGPVY
ncbi:hypothetical protein BDZ45DRAFT_772128 [Acephala macrosclerotiorum]|nr:hypothetical protein BDZ45DRAFT_772128 [Acephala macrosclerotiorum]